jgi:hypothetical protein
MLTARRSINEQQGRGNGIQLRTTSGKAVPNRKRPRIMAAALGD